MMRFKFYQAFIFFIGMLISIPSIAESPHGQLLNIPADIKPLLKKEMLAIEKGMKILVSSIATGNWGETAKIGKQIQTSFILKKNLSTEQMKLLHHSLPEQFIKMDQSFHQYAGMLAHAAEIKNMDIINFYFYKMSDSCVQCHSHYALERFPAFSKQMENHSPLQH